MLYQEELRVRRVIEIPTKEAPKAENRMRVAAYCRVSTQREQQDSSIDLQILHYKDIIDQNPNWINAGIFSDRSSGIKKTRRTQFVAMMKQCRAKKIDLILTKSISRFGRNTLTSLMALRELDSIGIDVFFENNYTDLIIADLSLHYFSDKDTKRIIKEIKRVLKPNGYLFF